MKREYNNIILEDVWPPKPAEKNLDMPLPQHYEKPEVIDISVGRQLFVDDFLVESMTTERSYHRPELCSEPLFYPETEMEKNAGYCSCACPFNGGIFYDSDDCKFKMWYHAGWFDGTAYAESEDGLHFRRLGELTGTGEDRVLPRIPGEMRDTAAVWLDHETKDPSEKYKMIVFFRKFAEDFRYYPFKPKHSHDIPGSVPPIEFTAVYKSADGIHFEEINHTTHTGDNTTFFYNPFRKKWVFSTREFSRLDRRVRVRGYIETDDFFQGSQWKEEDISFWSRTDIFDAPDPQLGYYTQLYGLDATPYESIMLGAFSVFCGPPNQIARMPKICNLKLAYSRDGFSWDRGDYSNFIECSKEPGTYNYGYIHPVNGLLTIVDEKIYFYFSAFSGKSEKFGEHKYSGGNLGMAVLRRDGFVSLDAKEQAEIKTEKLQYTGEYLFVNVNSVQGSFRCELLDERNQVIEGYSMEDCVPVTEDSTKLQVVWKKKEKLPKYKEPVKFRFELEKASMYAFWVSDTLEGKSRGYVGAGGPGYSRARDV